MENRKRIGGVFIGMSKILSLLILVHFSWVEVVISQGKVEPSLRFEVTVRRGLLEKPADGRLLVVISKSDQQEPRQSVGSTGMDSPVTLGGDVKSFAPGV